MTNTRRLLGPVMAMLGLVIAYVVLARAAVTSMGMLSFGRVWPYFINYQDFGFLRRSLFGTVFYPSRYLVAEYGLYPVAYGFSVALLAVATLISYFYVRSLSERGWTPSVHWLPLYLSPAFLMHFAYSTGDTDIVLAILLFVGLLVRRSMVLVALLCVVAVLTHEIFVLAYLPALLGVIYLEGNRDAPFAMPMPLLAGVGFAAIAFLATEAFGLWPLGRAAYEARLAIISPELLTRSGYWEVMNDTRQAIEYTHPQIVQFINWIYMALPILYVVTVTAVFYPRALTAWRRLVFVGVSLAPLVLIYFGTDAYRWISFAGLGALVVGLSVGSPARGSLIGRQPLLGLALVLPWALLGPLGNACCERPYPALQFVGEALQR